MALYCDTNLLMRLYVELPESAAALQRVGRHRRRGAARIPVTWLHELETFNAFEQLVFLRGRRKRWRGPAGRSPLAGDFAAPSLGDAISHRAQARSYDRLFRRPLSRQGQGLRMTPEKAALAAAQFDEDLAAGHGLESTPLPTHDLIRQARALAQRHTAKHGFRAYDLAHVAAALLLGCDEFWSFDAKAGQLAALEGLALW